MVTSGGGPAQTHVSAVLWCAGAGSPPGTEPVIYWQRYLSKPHNARLEYSLPQEIDDDADRWKSEYLRWLGDLGGQKLGASTLEQVLTIESGLSYWWMTLPSKPCFTEEALVYAVVRLWAVSELVTQLGVTSLQVIGADSRVAKVLRAWGEETGREVTFVPAPSEDLHSARTRPHKRILQPLWDVGSGLKFMASQYRRYGRSASDAVVVAADEDDEIVVVDYFDNFTVDRDGDDPYVSNYWGPLPAELARRAKPVHWIHIDVRSARLATVAAAREATLELNRASSAQRHSLLQDRIDSWLILRALRTYGHLVLLGVRVDHLKVQWRHKRSAMDMRPLVNAAWSSAFLGVDAAQNALWLHLFKTLAAEESASPTCLYLMENQPWELAMLHAWKTRGRAETAGVIHSTVRTWDLRYALGTQAIGSARAPGLPRPDVILANGPLARKMLEANGSQALELRSVEALRYMDLAGRRSRLRARVGGSQTTPRLLVIGEYDPSMQAEQVSLVAELLRAGSLKLDVVFRPHPSALVPVMPPGVAMVLSSALTLAEDLAGSDIVLCGDVSSGVVDAVIAGVPVIVQRDARYLDGQLLPGSALRATLDSPEMLSGALALALSADESPLVRASDIFYVDPSLVGWNTALGLNARA